MIRHGRSQADDEGVHEGRYDSALTETGHAQALRRVREFQAQGRRFDAVISSTLTRALSTAQHFAQAYGLNIERSAQWRECDNGVLAGLDREQARVLYPPPVAQGPYCRTGRTGESRWDLHLRVSAAMQDLVRRGPGHYLVVGHGGSLNAALSAMAGAAPRAGAEAMVFAFRDLGYATCELRSETSAWVLREFNGGY